MAGVMRKCTSAVVPNRWVAAPKWVAEEFLWCREQQVQCTLVKSQIFKTAYIKILCYISKTEIWMDIL